MSKFAIVGLAVCLLIGATRQAESAPEGTDRYRIEFAGVKGKRLKASISWSNPKDLTAKYQTEEINRQVPISFELDLPFGSTVIAGGSIPGDDPISIKIFMNGFECSNAKSIEPSPHAVRSCLP
jgi:hypothetical protein